MSNLISAVRARATEAYNVLSGEWARSNMTSIDDFVHSDDEVEVVEPNGIDRTTKKFKPPRNSSISKGSSVHTSGKPPRDAPKNHSNVIDCLHTVLCDRYVGHTQLCFHHDRNELEVRFLLKPQHASAISHYVKALDDVKRIYLQYGDFRAVGLSEMELKMIIVTVNKSCSVVTKLAGEPGALPNLVEYAILKSVMDSKFSHLPQTTVTYEVDEKYAHIVARRFKKSSKFFPPEEDLSLHHMQTRRAEKRKLSVTGSSNLRRESFVPKETTIIDSPPRKRVDEKAQEVKDRVVLHYPMVQSKNRITLTEGDVDRLAEGEFLNDNLIDFFFKFCMTQLEKWQQERIYFFSTHFYTTLVQRSNVQEPFDKVKRWTRSVNIFELDFLFIPINESCHWSLAVICNPGALAKPFVDDPRTTEASEKTSCILFFDSLRCHNETKIVSNLRSYLEKEFESRYNADGMVHFDASQAILVEPEVPRQSNSCDCGVFVLLYALELIKRYPVGIDDKDIASKFQESLNEVMFSHQNIVEFRDYLITLIGMLSTWQQSEIFDAKEKIDFAGLGLFTNSFTS
ncbi:unnamed protein product [Aphanomyces euteiches]